MTVILSFLENEETSCSEVEDFISWFAKFSLNLNLAKTKDQGKSGTSASQLLFMEGILSLWTNTHISAIDTEAKKVQQRSIEWTLSDAREWAFFMISAFVFCRRKL